MMTATVAVPWGIGDTVIWKGFELIVISVAPDGHTEAISPIWRVSADSSDFRVDTGNG